MAMPAAPAGASRPVTGFVAWIVIADLRMDPWPRRGSGLAQRIGIAASRGKTRLQSVKHVALAPQVLGQRVGTRGRAEQHDLPERLDLGHGFRAPGRREKPNGAVRQ